MDDLNQDFDFTALKLCGIFFVLYLYQVATGFDPGFNASSSAWWKFFTSIFGHSDLEHLLNNAFFIGLFGSIYERFTGTGTLLATFVAAALFANLSAFVFFPGSTIIGASGGAMGLLAGLAVYRPQKIGLALGVPLPMWAVLIVYVFINTVGLSGSNNVAYEAHLLGMVVGAIVGYRIRSRPYLDMEGDREEENWRRRIRKWEEKYML